MTRADFYIGVGETAEWLGSVNHDGFPETVTGPLVCITEDAFRKTVESFLREDESNGSGPTWPSQGWPWPWDNSQGTDFTYCFNKDHVEVFCFGRSYEYYEYVNSKDPADKKKAKQLEKKHPFPDMTKIQNVSLERSGMIILTAPAKR